MSCGNKIVSKCFKLFPKIVTECVLYAVMYIVLVDVKFSLLNVHYAVVNIGPLVVKFILLNVLYTVLDWVVWVVVKFSLLNVLYAVVNSS